MMNLIYRGVAYSSPKKATQAQLSSKTAKYRGCTYNISISTEKQLKQKLIYRGCPVTYNSNKSLNYIITENNLQKN